MGKIVNLFSSFRTTVVLLVLYAVALAIATMVEKYWGTQVAKNLIYYSPLLLYCSCCCLSISSSVRANINF